MNLNDFLLARIAEDEAVAQSNAQVSLWQSTNWARRPDLEHIRRHDPDRVLAECAAKRQIVHEYVTFKRVAESAAEDAGLPQALTSAGIVTGLQRALGHLATVYESHPDYREEWRP